jgi:urea carboxylase
MAGGLATTTTVVRADLWRMGQCRPGDTILFKRIDWDSALEIRKRTETFIQELQAVVSGKMDPSKVKALDLSVGDNWDETILHEIEADTDKGTVQVKFRQVSWDTAVCITLAHFVSRAATAAFRSRMGP